MKKWITYYLIHLYEINSESMTKNTLKIITTTLNFPLVLISIVYQYIKIPNVTFEFSKEILFNGFNPMCHKLIGYINDNLYFLNIFQYAIMEININTKVHSLLKFKLNNVSNLIKYKNYIYLINHINKISTEIYQFDTKFQNKTLLTSIDLEYVKLCKIYKNKIYCIFNNTIYIYNLRIKQWHNSYHFDIEHENIWYFQIYKNILLLRTGSNMYYKYRILKNTFKLYKKYEDQINKFCDFFVLYNKYYFCDKIDNTFKSYSIKTNKLIKQIVNTGNKIRQSNRIIVQNNNLYIIPYGYGMMPSVQYNNLDNSPICHYKIVLY